MKLHSDNENKTQNLACPIDGESLILEEKHLLCCNGHTFDIARQGYVNLLPVQHKRSKDPGDSKEMVLARKEFLDSGVYRPIASMLLDLLLAHVGDYEQTCLLDAGCGEGYYLDFISKNANKPADTNKLSLIGLDVSKPAIIEAAKRNKSITWLVGTNRQPPILKQSVDVIVCVFGFHSFSGFNKILKPGGKIILVEPGPEHLSELRDIIYKDAKNPRLDESADIAESGLSFIESKSLQFKTGLIANAMLRNLLLMTPHFYRANKEGREAAFKLETLDLTVDIVFRVFEKW